MLTEFGKTLRKIRIDNNELLINMAEKLDVTSSFLSAVENGKKAIPKTWANIISNLYSIDINTIKKAIDDSPISLKVDMKNLNTNDKRLMVSFARKFDELDANSKKDIERILNSMN